MTPSNINISPRLDIEIGRIDYAFDNFFDNGSLNGFSRSIEINWSIFGAKSFLEIDLGPTHFESFGKVDNIKINIPSYRDLDFQNILLDLEAANFESEGYGNFDVINLQGFFNQEQLKWTNIYFDVSMLSSANFIPFAVTSAFGAVDNFSMDRSINDQDLKIQITSENLAIDEPSLLSSKSNFGFISSNGELRFELSLNDVEILSNGGNIKRVKSQAVYSKDNLLKSLETEFYNGRLASGWSNFSNISVDVSQPTTTTYIVSSNGAVDGLDMYLSDNYVGKLPPSNFQLNASIDEHSNKILSSLKINFNELNPSDLSAVFDAEAQLYGGSTIPTCINLECTFHNLEIKYKLNLGDDWIEGTSLCQKTPCIGNALSSVLKTSNTQQVLAKLQSMEILSPISIMYFFSAINSGEKSGSGHIINFN